MRRRTFAVGRVDRKTTEVRVLARPEHEPGEGRFAVGPFRVAAVVRATGPVVRLER